MRILFFILLFHGAIGAHAQGFCQIKIPSNTEVVRKSPIAERHGSGKTYWICGNTRVTFRTGNATIFVEAGCNVSLNDGDFTVYAKNGASIYEGSRCRLTIIREPEARINGGSVVSQGTDRVEARKQFGHICPVLNYDYSEAPDGLCPKLPMREMPEPVAVVINTPKEIGNTYIETPRNPDLPDEPHTNETRHILPANTEIINQNKNAYESNRVFWVCKGVTCWINGDNNKIYAEQGAKITISGNRNTIMIKAGVGLNLGNGGGNEVIYREDTDLKSNRSKKTKFTKMQSIEFQSSAVSGGCR